MKRQGADRGNKLARDRGLKGTSYGAAARGIRLSDIDRDTRVIITALMARGQTRDEISSKTGAHLNVIEIIRRSLR